MRQEQSATIAVQTDESVLAIQAEALYGAAPFSIARMGGYSNRNYGITTTSGIHYTARIARMNRSAGSVTVEEHILRSLAAQRCPVPVPCFLQQQPPHQLLSFADGEHYVHLFQRLTGSIDCLWWQQCSTSRLTQLFTQLAVLHRHMHTIAPLPGYGAALYHYPLPATAPAILAGTGTGQYVLEHWHVFRQKVKQLEQDMAATFPWQAARCQWIHGDIQLENILFQDDRLTAILDFELAGWDACEKDVILSAFRTCKEGNTDAPFQYDAERLALALDAYRCQDPTLCVSFFDHYERLWKPFFCLDQTMVYLRNAFDGIWQLAEGIGFLPCFNEVLAYHSIKQV